MPRGLRSDEHLAQRRVFIVSHPRTPSYGGRLPEGLIMASRRAKTRSVIPLASAHQGLQNINLVDVQLK